MRISIENRLYMDCPEGFRELTEEEKAAELEEPKELVYSSLGETFTIREK